MGWEDKESERFTYLAPEKRFAVKSFSIIVEVEGLMEQLFHATADRLGRLKGTGTGSFGAATSPGAERSIRDWQSYDARSRRGISL